jgi:hypothetical protein
VDGCKSFFKDCLEQSKTLPRLVCLVFSKDQSLFFTEKIGASPNFKIEL